MNCQADLQSWLKSAQNCVLQVIRPCAGWIPCLQRRRQVHPAASSPFAGREFIHLSSHRRIRVVHIGVNECNSSGLCVNGAGTHMEIMGLPSEGCHYTSKQRHLSLVSNCSELSSEEYWFTRWNKPLRMSDSCNCSFRKSWRNSLRDSRIMLNQVEERIKNDTSQILDDSTLREECVDQEDKLSSRSYKLLQIESFVEEVLQEVWNEVFSCLPQIERKVENSSQLELRCVPHCNSMQHNNSSELHYVCSMKDEPVGKNQFRNDDVIPHAVISCHEIPDDNHAVETLNHNIEGTHKQQLVNTSPKSVGCVNPTFFGSSINPDLLEYAVVPGAPSVECDAFFLRTDLPGFVGMGAECFDDPDSGFNTVSLECNRAINADCFKVASKHSDVGQLSHVTEKTLTESYTANPNEIHLTALQARISADSQFSDKIIEAKDDAHEYNQTTFTSVDIRLPDTCRTQSNIADVGPKVQKSDIQHRKIKQCYHTANLKRLKPLLYFLHGVGCSADVWSALLQYFTAAGYEVVAPDMLGHGYSAAPDKASAYAFHRLLKDSIDIFDRFVGEHRSCVVIGHAYGCSLAAALARYRAQQVSHLILISGGGPAPLAPRTADSRPPSISPCLLACMKPLLMCGFRRNILYAPCGKHIESCPSMTKGVPRYVLHHVAQGQDWPEGDATFHRRILAPTLLVHGLQDPYVTLVQECEMERREWKIKGLLQDFINIHQRIEEEE
ncbi:uncharacterized protein LOC111874381 isoform X2 [Cryptotermes secundus]|uniref:uncharacterized protein LOC111874381 isoform X2 n=1 Tax=Cryptotermes secundus TaxID=105785 RepID=UPI000CD7ACD0|nr:uncharacterized protein LOC111874381 isoform X2 [Cryptotermes secundus]